MTCPSFAHYLDEDVDLIEALKRLGLSAGPFVWPSPEKALPTNQSPPALAYLVRSTWDYHLYPQPFAEWLHGLKGIVWNSPASMLWNMHKGYLLELQDRGVNVVPTRLIRQGEILRPPTGSAQLIAKPAVSAGARATVAGSWQELEEHCLQLLSEGDLLIQPYLASVAEYGERSLLFVEGQFTHAVLRNQPLKDGAGLENLRPLVEPSAAEMQAALKALAALAEVPLYARIDLLADDSGAPLLLELEIIEPRMFLQECPAAVNALAQACARRLGR